MRKSCLIIMFFMIAGYAGMAQLNPDSLSDGSPTITTAKLFTQLANAIKPTSFLSTSQTQVSGLLAGAENTNDPAAVANNVVSLAALVKPDLYQSASGPANLKAAASKVSTASQAGALLKTFESGLKPSALTGVWKMQKTNWLNEITQLK